MKTKTINFYILLIFLIFLIASCCKHDTYSYVDNKLKLQYQEGDTLIYQDKNGIKDTLFLIQIEHGYEKVSNEDNCNTSENREWLSYDFNTSNVKIKVGTYVEIRYFNRTIIRWLDESFEAGLNAELKDSITINNRKYYGILKLGNMFTPKLVTTVYYDKALGVIRYETADGNIWDLINKTL